MLPETCTEMAAAAWIGAMLERLDRREAPLPAFKEAAVRADRARFDAAPAGRSPQLDISDPRERWAQPAASAVDGLAGLVTRLHERTRGASWEADLWLWLLQSLPGGVPEAVVHDLIDREIAIEAIGHCKLSDAALWRLAGRVDEALLTLAKRRYVSERCTADQFEEVLHAFPEHEWMLTSLPGLLPSSRHKAVRLAEYIREHPRRDELIRHAGGEFLEVWGRAAAKHGRT